MTPTAAPAYVGPLTWDDSGWRCCRVCEVEWVGETRCFLDPRHPGARGRLRSFCRHGLRRVTGGFEPLCPRCERHEATDFTAEFLDVFALAADRALGSAGPGARSGTPDVLRSNLSP